MPEPNSEPQPLRRDPYPTLVALGTHVEVVLVDQAGNSERLDLDVVPDRAADFEAGFLGAGTPLARAIMGCPAGSVLPYRVGDMVEVRILSVSPSTRAADHRAAELRHAAADAAVDRANLEDMIRLALAVQVKWGDYDPEGLVQEHSEDS